MNTESEKTIPVVMDSLDFPPNAFLGFTNGEFAVTCLVCSGAYLIPMVMVSGVMFGSSIYGFIGAVAFGVFTSVAAARRAETIKKGRPSYMLWVDLKRHLQFVGFFDITYGFGFTKTCVWDVMDEQRK
ncbi:hypothetical protein ACP3V3_02090 [Vibrio sp. PNB22_3_1]